MSVPKTHRLTAEQFSEWCNHRSYKGQWDEVSQSEDFLNCFNFLPNRIKRNITKYLSLDVNPKQVGTYYALCLQFKTQFPDHVEWLDFAEDDALWDRVLNLPVPHTLAFSQILEDTVEYADNMTPDYRIENGFYAETFVLLRSLHGEESTVSVMEEWINSKQQIELSALAYLVEKWDEMKNHPFDWAVSIATGSCREATWLASGVSK